MKRKCIVKQLWAWGNPYIEIAGWFILMGTVILSGLSLAEKAAAFDQRLTSLEQNRGESAQDIKLLNQKVDLIMDFWGIKKRK